jgi:hypothetical protein
MYLYIHLRICIYSHIGYTMLDWREDIKKVLMQAGIKDKPTTFLFSDIQIINELMIEDINNLLNSGMFIYVCIYLYMCIYIYIHIYICNY